jgi:primosomal protein N' (replication factor Y)
VNYYEVALLKSSAPHLTYESSTTLTVGHKVLVPLKSKLKEAVVLKQVEQPTFKTALIDEVLPFTYSPHQLTLAYFMASYYFSSVGEALGVMLPFHHESVSDLSSLEIIHTPTLSSQQQEAYEALVRLEKALLFGVTGSGKTEIFITLMAKVLSEGKSAIFLMPEISLTPQMKKRLEVYFGKHVAMWHSKLTKVQKGKIVEGIRSGEVRIVAGARSALFTPLQNLGLIVVDEEHDDSYKAMTRPRYHARDMALYMGEKLGAKVVLASATPSITSYYKYDVVRLKKPFIETKKSYHFTQGSSLNSTIFRQLQKHYESGGQSILFLPTRGNFKYLYCNACGKTHLCPYCSVGMSLHRNYRYLKCHYCNFTEAIVEQCTQCGHTPLSSERMGTVEAIEQITQAVEGIRIEQFDKDSITTAKKLKEALARFEAKESDLLLGTQMLSKGHDYANVTLSIILGLDYILGLADYRARAKALSLMQQIAGRSGRSKEAEVLIQSDNQEFFETYLEDYEAFIKDELLFLEMANYPPFSSLARILIAHKEETKTNQILQQALHLLKPYTEVEIVGSGKAPVERVAGKFRYHILLRAFSKKVLLQALHAVKHLAVEVDMDPVEFG